MAGPTDLKGQIIVAALELSEGNLDAEFTFEELLVEAWKQDNVAWGLRGFEADYPDSERIHREIDSRGKGQAGVVKLGLLHRVGPRTYRLTPKGLARAVALSGSAPERLERLDRKVEAEIQKILEHPSFRSWLSDPTLPRSFSDAGHFWGVAPGTPPRVIRERIQKVDDWLNLAESALDERGVDEMGEGRGRLLFDRVDIERCREFHEVLKDRFANELARLGA